jgi:hypothetical protein
MWADFFDTFVVEHAESTIDEVIVLGDWAFGRGHFVERYR